MLVRSLYVAIRGAPEAQPYLRILDLVDMHPHRRTVPEVLLILFRSIGTTNQPASRGVAVRHGLRWRLAQRQPVSPDAQIE